MTRTRRTVMIVGLLVGMVLLLSAGMELPASAADAFKMGVVDPQAVLERSVSGKRALDALRDYARTRQKVLASDEDDLKNYEKSLKEQEAKLSDKEKQEKADVFRAKIQAYQKRAQEFNQDLSAKQKEMVDDYMKKIAVATKTVAEKNGYTLVVDKGSEQTIKIVIYFKDAIDITEQVVKEFDRTNK